MGGIDQSRIRETLDTHKKMVAEFERSAIDVLIAASEAVVETFRKGGTLYLCGNGGSAADAQHIAGEMVGRFRTERRALPAMAFSTDTSVLTCVANDYSYDDVFARRPRHISSRGTSCGACPRAAPRPTSSRPRRSQNAKAPASSPSLAKRTVNCSRWPIYVCVQTRR